MNQTTGVPPPYAYAGVRPGSTAATWSLICGILAWLCFPIIGAVLAVALGYVSRTGARAQGWPPSGMAMAGIILGVVQLIAVGASLAIFVALAILGSIAGQH